MNRERNKISSKKYRKENKGEVNRKERLRKYRKKVLAIGFTDEDEIEGEIADMEKKYWDKKDSKEVEN
jgi:hypothetical protein